MSWTGGGMTMAKTLTAESLTGFIGTEVWYRHPQVPWVTFTEGVKYVADAGEAYWLVDEIATAQMDPAMRRNRFQHWCLKLNAKGNGAVLTCDDGNDNIIRTKELTFTDFPLPEIHFYYTDSVILLVGEY